MKRINNILATILLMIVALAPVPLGSNRPVFWLLWAAAIFFLFGTYLIVVSRSGRRLRRTLSQIGFEGVLAVIFVSYAVVQTMPIPEMFAQRIDSPIGMVGQDFISLSRDATLVASIRWASYAVFFFLLLQVVENRVRARRMAWALFLIVTAHAAFGLVSFRMLGDDFFWGPKTAYVGFVTGTFINRNSFATFLGFGAVLGFALLLRELLRERGGRGSGWIFSAGGIQFFILWMCLALILSALFSTGSRMGVGATGIGLSVVCVLTIRKYEFGSLWTTLAVISTMLIVFTALMALFGTAVLDRSIFSGSALTDRLELYGQTIELIKARPFLGFGFDAFELAFEQVHRPPVSPDLVWSRSHSTYLSHWTEMGLVVGSVPLIICGTLAIRMALGIRHQERDYVLQIAGLGVLTLAAVHSIVDFSLEITANVFLFLAVMALASPFRKRSAGPKKKKHALS